MDVINIVDSFLFCLQMALSIYLYYNQSTEDSFEYNSSSKELQEH